MVKSFKLLLSLTLLFGLVNFSNFNDDTKVVSAAVDAADVDSYYSSLYDESGNILYKGEELLSKLNTIISTDTKNGTYDDLTNIYRKTDVDPTDPNKVILYYTGESRTWDFAKYNDYKINREHVWCRSHFGKSSEDPGDQQTTPNTDAHQVRPCDSSLNESRNNSYYDELTSYNYSDSYGNKWSGGIFYPQEDYRGDIARICFYVATRYTNLGFIDGATSGNTGKNYVMGNISALLKWNILYGVSESEERRNVEVEKYQNNRNPFIDHPEYAVYIWEDFNSKTENIVSSYVDTYNITFNTNGGSTLDAQEVLSNFKANKPSNPTKNGTTFVGWYKDPSLETAYDFDTKVTSNITLYAKWSDGSTDENTGNTGGSGNTGGDSGNVITGEQIVIDLSKQGYTNSQDVSEVSSDGITVTFDKNTGNNGPKYYNTGTAVRAYGGNTITINSQKSIASIEFVFGSGDGSNEIISNVGTFSSPKWSSKDNTTNEVIFTINGSSGHRRIKQILVKLYESSNSETTIDLSNQNIKTKLSFSYTKSTSESSSGSEVFNGTNAFDSFNGSSTTNFKYGSQLGNDEATVNKVSSAFGLLSYSEYLRPAKKIDNESDYALLLGSSSNYGIITFKNVYYNAKSINVDLAGWSTNSSVTLTNATCNGSSTITFNSVQEFSNYKLDIIDLTKAVTLSSNVSSDKRTFVDNVSYSYDSSSVSFTFNNFLMRYQTTISKELFESINGVSFGALINTSSNNPIYEDTTIEEFDLLYTSSNKYLDINISKDQIIEDDLGYTMSAALTKIPNNALTTEVVTAFYIKTEDKVYFTNTKIYSVSSLVDKYLSEYSLELTEEEIEVLNALDSYIG